MMNVLVQKHFPGNVSYFAINKRMNLLCRMNKNGHSLSNNDICVDGSNLTDSRMRIEKNRHDSTFIVVST